jgi:hypothetical protein
MDGKRMLNYDFESHGSVSIITALLFVVVPKPLVTGGPRKRGFA